jgi:hypothetical protein
MTVGLRFTGNINYFVECIQNALDEKEIIFNRSFKTITGLHASPVKVNVCCLTFFKDVWIVFLCFVGDNNLCDSCHK